MKKSSKPKAASGEFKGMRPNVMQRRPGAPKPSPAKPFSINRNSGSR